MKRQTSPAPHHLYVRDWIYGGIDGAVTTFAIVAGVAGSKLTTLVAIILGLANLIADGFSMAASNYLGTKSELENYVRHQHDQRERIITHADAEREKIRHILASKGIVGEELKALCQMITGNHELWISMLLHEEHGLPKSVRSPWIAALSTFVAFLICGSVPLLPYFFHLPLAFSWSISLTCGVFFLIGSLKSRWSLESWWYSGLTTLGIGASVALIAYGIGYLFHLFQ